MKSAIIALSFGLMASGPAFAADLDPAAADALAKTQQTLTSPSLRDKALSESPDAKLMDSQLTQLTGGGSNREAVYSLSSKIFEDMVKDSGGDAMKMMEQVKKAMTNPEGFLNTLSPENQAALHDLARKIDDKTTLTREPTSASKP